MTLLWTILIYFLIVQLLVYKRSIAKCYSVYGNKNLFVFLTMGLLLALTCLRSLDTGNDTVSYYYLFEHYKGDSQIYSSEALLWMDSYVDIGYRFINRLFSKISGNYQLFISFVAIFMYTIVNKYIKKYSSNCVLSVFLFFLMFFHVYLNLLRQAIAISIILMGIQYLFDKKNMRFAFVVCMAALFHKTALIALLLIPIAHKKHFSVKKSIVVILISILIVYSGVVGKLLGIIGYSGKYIYEERGLSTYAGIAISSIVFLLMLFLNRRMISTDTVLDGGDDFYRRFYIRIPVVQVIISIASLALPIFYRCEYYFTIFYLTGIPYFLMNNNDLDSNKKIITRVLLIAYITYICGILIWRPEWYTEFQYHFFWN